MNHGIFTNISYFLAFFIVMAGSVLGFAMIMTGLSPSSEERMENIEILGALVFFGSWLGALGIGVLAEISRKLTHSESTPYRRSKQENDI